MWGEGCNPEHTTAGAVCVPCWLMAVVGVRQAQKNPDWQKNPENQNRKKLCASSGAARVVGRRRLWRQRRQCSVQRRQQHVACAGHTRHYLCRCSRPHVCQWRLDDTAVRNRLLSLPALIRAPPSGAYSAHGAQPHACCNAGTFCSHALRLPDVEYGRALDCLVKACCDVIVTVAEEDAHAQVEPMQEQIFLGRRQVEPQPDWWFIGGRMWAAPVTRARHFFTHGHRLPGESATQACLRHLKRELGIADVACDIKHVSTQLFVWDSR